MVSLLKNLPVAKYTSDQTGYQIICDLWQRVMGISHDMGVVNTDALSHSNKFLYKCLQTTEKENKYLEACHR